MNNLEKYLLLGGRLFLCAVCVALVAWIVPWAYHFATDGSAKTPFTLYSSVVGDFAQTQSRDGIMHYTDCSGHTYTAAQFDSILPAFYYRQLLSEGRLPDSLCGVAVTPRVIQTTNFNFRTAPSDVNRPQVALYPLLESLSGRVDLQMPDDVFRITDSGIEFVDMAANAVNRDKSDRFTQMLLKKRFAFPAKIVAGNGTNRKEYDNGYLIVDAEGKLFNLKMQRGRPYVRAIALPDSVEVRHIFVTEFRDRRALAFIGDAQKRFFMLEAGSYALRQIDIPPFDPTCESLSIIGNLCDWTLCVTSLQSKRYYAIAADNLQRLKMLEMPDQEPTLAQRVGQWLLPVQLRFQSPLDRDVRPRIAFCE